jgi:hypothetical protein
VTRLARADSDVRAVARLRLGPQVGIGLALFAAYLVVDLFEDAGRRAAAHRHGQQLYDLEQHLHLDVEKTLNHWLTRHETLTTLANYEYAWTYILSALALLTWIWLRRRELWRPARDSFLVLNLLAIATFALYPTAPPRFLGHLGFVDTVSSGGTIGSWGSGVVDAANQLAAMPSLHVGWALWVSVVLARITASRWVQLLSAVHVLATLFVVMATANHYLLDAVAVVVPVALGVGYAEWKYVAVRGEVVPSNDAFFLHVEGTGAAQHVGGVVVLEPAAGRPTLEEVRDLVRGELAALPRFRQRLVASRWRRPRWVEVDEPDLDWHVTERRSADGLVGLWRVIADCAEQPMPRDRPLWRVLLVRDVGSGPGAGPDVGPAADPDGDPPPRSALVVLMHHSIADGIGTVLHTLRLFRPRTDVAVPAGAGPGALVRAGAITVGLAQLATDGGAGRLGPASLRREFAVLDPDLARMRRTAAAHGVRVTDLVLALVADAVHATAPALAASLGGRLRCSVPLMVRTPDTGAEGNATAAVMVDVPVDGRPLPDLLATIRTRTGRLRRPTRAMASRFVMATGLRLLPEPCAGWFARTVYGGRFLHVVVSNMPGPTPDLTFCGLAMPRTYPILPVAPGTALSLGALSWSGIHAFGVATDPALLPVEQLVARMRATLAALDPGPDPGSGSDPGSVLARPLEGKEQPSA